MTDNIEEIGPWFRMEESYPEFQHEMWRNGATGEVLVVEEQRNPWATEYHVLLLPENFEDDNTPVDSIADGLGDVQEAIGKAREYMNDDADTDRES